MFVWVPQTNMEITPVGIARNHQKKRWTFCVFCLLFFSLWVLRQHRYRANMFTKALLLVNKFDVFLWNTNNANQLVDVKFDTVCCAWSSMPCRSCCSTMVTLSSCGTCDLYNETRWVSIWARTGRGNGSDRFIYLTPLTSGAYSLFNLSLGPASLGVWVLPEL